MTTNQRIKDSFAKQSMMATFGAQVDEVTQGGVVLSAPILDSALQQQGAAHAALTFALGDTAAGYAALSVLPEDQEVMTAEIKINLLAPGRGQRLRAVGQVVKPGRRLIVVKADVYALDGDAETHVAILQGTMVPVSL